MREALIAITALAVAGFAGAAGFFAAAVGLAAAGFRAGAAFLTAVVRAVEAALGVFAAAGFFAAAALFLTAMKSLLQIAPHVEHRVISNIKSEPSQHPRPRLSMQYQNVRFSAK